MWRPDNWEKTKAGLLTTARQNEIWNEDAKLFIEAGADAMLVALKPVLKRLYDLIKELNERR